ncbi:CotD family spore coat protein [Shouchella shacheensis]|uniref:CotD family spore coat protein n=1 Tax=Shouchella shacheensis TaxID=1649580 RepID=UPI000AAF6AEA|nr:CotD family spore coat protein [Shouchella shacheensis]
MYKKNHFHGSSPNMPMHHMSGNMKPNMPMHHMSDNMKPTMPMHHKPENMKPMMPMHHKPNMKPTMPMHHQPNNMKPMNCEGHTLPNMTLPTQTKECPPVVHPTKHNCVESTQEYIVPHIHPSHTTHVNNHVFKNVHHYPHTESVTENVMNDGGFGGPGGPVQGWNNGGNNGPMPTAPSMNNAPKSNTMPSHSKK